MTSAMERVRDDVAKALEVPVLVVSAIGRAGVGRLKEARELPPSDLVGLSRESGAVEYDSAAVLVISWDEVDEGQEQTGLITVAKSRYGREAHVEAVFDGATGKWSTGDLFTAMPRGKKVDEGELTDRLITEATTTVHPTLSALVAATKGKRTALLTLARKLVHEGTLVIKENGIHARKH